MTDFTMTNYEELCRVILSSEYEPITVKSYIGKMAHDNNHNYIILRHDVDRNIFNALTMAAVEQRLGIQTTYYFRYPSTFQREFIEKIQSLDHEIGYHYEVLSKTQGDVHEAMKLFEQELNGFREYFDIRTICMHGSPLSCYDNRDLWDIISFTDFGIMGDASLSINDARYYSDSGRSWNGIHNMRDFLPCGLNGVGIDTFDKIVNLIVDSPRGNLYLSVHPERWAVNPLDWIFGYSRDIVFNIGKQVLMRVR